MSWTAASRLPAGGWLSRWRDRRRRKDNALEMLDQLENLLSAGLPLDRAMHVLRNSSDSPLVKQLVADLLLAIEKGTTLSGALALHPQIFGTFEVNMIRAGEEGGVLAAALRRLVQYQRSQQEFRRYLVTSAIYPFILLVFGILAVGGILLFVLPSFVEAYSDLAKVGFPANVLIGLSTALQDYGWFALATLVAAAIAARFWLRSPGGRLRMQSLILRLPAVGQLVLKSELSRVLQSLSVLLGAGVPILTAMRLSRALTPYAQIDQALADTERSLREGTGLAKPLIANPLFPRLIGQMALVGEESGALDRMLQRVADRLEGEVRAQLRTLLSIVEPGLIIAIGLVVGLIVVSMVAAILSLNEMPL